ncbi:NAD(P)/FAD-dependent oxidoreductase [Nocardiopsis akebiae]|uniref:NAD(P)/FAD-dependent oxidoreductase n=1 Tax=Nocardiopsis akebiae TaxID=2831968 RepID=A0ABX8C849_9ACTN|nr:ArsO family NAD(P)H-dependent flavin-containing monooxygenase [Nocardiopsis akebiae]QUX30600.1 NAD(P)/FAD-dependent oxidoreductase [Nocardiopsis akebiae]
MEHLVDVAVIGGGQVGLAAGYFLRRAKADFVILDDREEPGGSWPEYWDSLRLFSPAAHSMLPGWWMPAEEGQEYPSARHVAWYLTEYERRYALPVRRSVHVRRVERAGSRLRLVTDGDTWSARYVISATGTWRAPHIPDIPGRDVFEGEQLHTVDYRRPEEFVGRHVAVVGGGNSAAQILAEVSAVTRTTWITSRPPRFLPDDVDGRALFALATGSQKAAERGEAHPGGIAELGDIVVVPSVSEARKRGDTKAEPMFDRLTHTGMAWADGSTVECDVIVWCTGFYPVLRHLDSLGLVNERGRVVVEGTRVVAQPRLHLLGYGDWTGPASATLIGAARTAKATVAKIIQELEREARPGTK